MAEPSVSRPAARLLLIEAVALPGVLGDLDEEAFARPTVCVGWSVRDVLAHCAAVLTRTATGDLHRFSPEDNERDVEERRGRSLTAVLDELNAGYRDAAVAIDRADGRLDGVGLGEWVHGGDIREAVGADAPYASVGAELAVTLLAERSAALGRARVDAIVDGAHVPLGAEGEVVGRLVTDTETFVRLCSGRRPHPARYTLEDVAPEDLVLFG